MGQSVPYCELFDGKSLFEEQVGSPRHSPRAFSLSGLEAHPMISDFATQPLNQANFMALRACEDKTQGDDKFAPSLSRPRTWGEAIQS